MLHYPKSLLFCLSSTLLFVLGAFGQTPTATPLTREFMTTDSPESNRVRAVVGVTPEICAGGLNTPAHQSEVTVTVKNKDGSVVKNQVVSLSVDTFMPGSSTPLAPTDPDADLMASLSPTTATTDDNGVIHATLTSSMQIGAKAVIKTSIGDKSLPVTMKNPDGNMGVEADELIADGESTTDVFLGLNYNSSPVDGHNIHFYIAEVEDENGNQVSPEADGSFPGYGTVTNDIEVTDEDGLAYATYTVGNLPGVITFGSEDISATVNSNDGNQSLAVNRFLQDEHLGMCIATGVRSGFKRTKKVEPSSLPIVSVNLIYITGASRLGSIKTTTDFKKSSVNGLLKTVFSKTQVKFIVKNLYNRHIDSSAEVSPGVWNGNHVMSVNLFLQSTIPAEQRAGVTIIFVPDLLGITTSVNGQVNAIPGCTFMLRDNLGPGLSGKGLAHEIGHCLGLYHPQDVPVPDINTTEDLYDNLMYNIFGRKITPFQHLDMETTVMMSEEDYEKGPYVDP